MEYRGYTAGVVYDDQAALFHGEVLGIRAVVAFQGSTCEEVSSAFRDSADDYLEWCDERDVAPETPSSGH